MVPKIEKETFESHSDRNENDLVKNINDEELKYDKNHKIKIVWFNVFLFVILHLGTLYGVYCCFFNHVKMKTFLFSFLVYMMGALGITAGAHRLWSHRSYKAKLPLRIILGFFQTIALQVILIKFKQSNCEF
jgi:stearoyl-CoA desaturase (delta-9 desaturase)